MPSYPRRWEGQFRAASRGRLNAPNMPSVIKTGGATRGWSLHRSRSRCWLAAKAGEILRPARELYPDAPLHRTQKPHEGREMCLTAAAGVYAPCVWWMCHAQVKNRRANPKFGRLSVPWLGRCLRYKAGHLACTRLRCRDTWTHRNTPKAAASQLHTLPSWVGASQYPSARRQGKALNSS